MSLNNAIMSARVVSATASTSEAIRKLQDILSDKSKLIGCEYNLYKALQDIATLQEKISFFLERINMSTLNKMNEQDFCVYIKAITEEYERRMDFAKKCISEDKLIK